MKSRRSFFKAFIAMALGMEILSIPSISRPKPMEFIAEFSCAIDPAYPDWMAGVVIFTRPARPGEGLQFVQ